MTKKLVIVESPAKANTIKRFLGKDYTIMASYGHIRDLPQKEFGIDIEKDYKPKYTIMKDKRETVNKLKKAAPDFDTIYLATDPDREGEAISYHLAHILKLDTKKSNRIVFNEITKQAVNKAIENARPIDMNMFYSQQARRLLDRIVGYKVSPVLWKKIKKGLSAGRVQSVALELICEKEDEINAFIPKEYWNLNLKLSKIADNQIFLAKYYGTDGKKNIVRNEEEAVKIYDYVKNNLISISDIRKTKRRRNPQAPFITSTLQQDAYNKLGFTTARTMKIAQELYEGVNIDELGTAGLITYMRTDSTRISKDFQEETKQYIIDKYGKDYAPKSLPVYKKSDAAQDAHEAVRPTDFNLTPEKLENSLSKEQFLLYTLIYNRYLASQMTPAVLDNTSVDISCGPHLFRATGSVIVFKGYLTVYEDKAADVSDEDKEDYENAYLPNLSVNEQLERRDITKAQKFTLPPARYTEASLVRKLEENGIGRPSTYSSIINTIITRNYVKREKRTLHPTELGIAVNNFMLQAFENLMDYGFTAEMEKKLDEIEAGKIDWLQLIDEFYKDFELRLAKADKIEKMPLVSKELCDNCGVNMIVKSGRYGDFLGCPNFPECKLTKPIVDDTGYTCPKCGGRVINKKTANGTAFISCENYPTCDFSSWGTITGDMCPKCDNFLLKVFENRVPYIVCSLDTCDYKVKFEK